MFELSFNKLIVPRVWKKANITATFKKGDIRDPSNYRPVSLTCVIGKIMEGIVKDSIMAHMKRHNLFSDSQFGFITGRSTLLKLIKVMEKWTEILDEGQAVDIAWCDFMKAFDKVPHRRLIAKLKMYNLGTKYIEWVRSFLRERKQRVVINGV